MNMFLHERQQRPLDERPLTINRDFIENQFNPRKNLVFD
jgi:hypothetical protein